MTVKALLTKVARALGRGARTAYIDHFDATRVAGWAFDAGDLGTPAMLSLHVDGKPEMNIVADVPREDVLSAGLGPLHCGFDVALPRRLRDGQAHQVVLRLGSDGPVLPGGTLSIPAGSKEFGSDDAQTGEAGAALSEEGVVFFDAQRERISGWALGCADVLISFDGGPSERVVLNQEVPGLGSGLRPGFHLPVPEALQDGARHEARVFFGQTERELDGSPVGFALWPSRLRIDLFEFENQTVTLHVRELNGALSATPVVVDGDGQRLDVSQKSGTVVFDVPSDVTNIIVSSTEGEILARFEVSMGWRKAPLSQELPQGALSDAQCAAATEAFAAFCRSPDARFDPKWYRWAHPEAFDLADNDALLEHYATVGAADGVGPGPYFDETAARLLYPALGAAVAKGKVPCAFAVELVLGEGMLNTQPAITPAAREALYHDAGDPLQFADVAPTPAARPLPLALPGPTPALQPSGSIYAAWVSRLEIDSKARGELQQDEDALRHEIRSVALTRAPLVSIIMPSWNRAFTIGEAIQSVLEQSYSNWELIVCDDASEDRTSEVVRRFDDPRIRYMKFLKSNGAGARNKGLRNARGEYIAYLDSDNIWHPLFLDMMVRRLMASPGTSIAYSAYLDTEIDGAKVRLLDTSRPNFRPIRLSSKNFMDLNTIMHHRRVYDWMGGFDNDLPRLQDWDLVLRYTSIFRPVFVNHVGVFYRRNVAWGQVTHLFMGSNAQNTVNEKTRARIENQHEHLKIKWPERSRVTVLCGGPEGQEPDQGDLAVAHELARLATSVADVDLVVLGKNVSAGTPTPDDAVTCHSIPLALQCDPGRLGHALAPILSGQPVMSVGCRGMYLRAIEGLDTALTYRLLGAGEGSVLQNLDDPQMVFDLGALSMTLPDGAHSPETATVLVLPPSRMRSRDRDTLLQKLSNEAQRRNLTLLLPPGSGKGWHRLGGGGTDAETEYDVSAALGQVGMTVSLSPVSELSPFYLALLNSLQSRGVPAAVLPDKGRARRTGFATQWLQAKAAYEISVNDPKWIFDKVRKLMNDTTSYDRLSERSRTVHRIAYHPDLAKERLGHALYRILHEAPKREVIDGRG